MYFEEQNFLDCWIGKASLGQALPGLDAADGVAVISPPSS